VKPAIPERPPWLLGWFDTYGYILLVGMANEELAAAAAAAAAAATELAADAGDPYSQNHFHSNFLLKVKC